MLRSESFERYLGQWFCRVLGPTWSLGRQIFTATTLVAGLLFLCVPALKNTLPDTVRTVAWILIGGFALAGFLTAPWHMQEETERAHRAVTTRLRNRVHELEARLAPQLEIVFRPELRDPYVQEREVFHSGGLGHERLYRVGRNAGATSIPAAMVRLLSRDPPGGADVGRMLRVSDPLFPQGVFVVNPSGEPTVFVEVVRHMTGAPISDHYEWCYCETREANVTPARDCRIVLQAEGKDVAPTQKAFRLHLDEAGGLVFAEA